MTVPQTDTGRRVEYTKANGRTLVKELGKLPRNFGRRGAPWVKNDEGVAVKWPGDCLPKTQVSAKS
jgi:hypothetical protein